MRDTWTCAPGLSSIWIARVRTASAYLLARRAGVVTRKMELSCCACLALNSFRRGPYRLLKLRLRIARCRTSWLEALYSRKPQLTDA